MQTQRQRKDFQSRKEVSSPLLNLYHSAKARYEWKELVYEMLLGQAGLRDGTYTARLSKYRWDVMVAYYHVDALNFPHLREKVYAGLVSFTCTKTGLSTEEVERIFTAAERRLSLTKDAFVPALVAVSTDDAQVKRVSCGKIHYDISTKVWNTFEKDPFFLETFLNYSFLNPESGLFWSIPKEVYAFLQDTAVGLPALECFASPFNHNLNAFCSVFAADMELNYPEGVRCYGNFFSYIDTLKAKQRDVRLIVNPPYTDRLIDLVAEKIISYLEVQKNAEFIAMLPDWTPQEGIRRLEELEGSVAHRFAPQEFYLYDSIHQKSIKPVGMSILIIVNLGGDVEASQAKLDELKEIITTLAARVY